MADERAANRDLWESWTDIHLASAHYDVEGFIADPSTRPLDWVTREVVGDVTGKRLLHLQCHIGIDTLRLAIAGALGVTGVDLSPKAVAAARSIARRLGIDASFVVSDVVALPDTVPQGAFDVIFTSYGTIEWLPDLEPWADSVATRLAPGGVFHFIDVHPFLWVFDEECADAQLAVRHSYYERDPMHFEEHGSYADPSADFVGDSYAWQHTLAEIIGVLASRGLVIEAVREYAAIAWKAMDCMEKGADGLWRLPERLPQLPLMLGLSARKPG